MKNIISPVSFVCLAIVALSTSTFAETFLPQWEPGFHWSIQTYLDINMKDPDSNDQIDMIIEDDAPDYTCVAVETRRLSKGERPEHVVYRLQFSGQVTGEGIADVELFDTEIPVELRNGTQTGEMWVDTDTLGTVYVSRFITGDLWAYYLFTWRDVGHIEIAFSEEYQPERDCFQFPAEVGDQWSEVVNLFFFGRYLVTYDLGSGPETQEDTFDEVKVFDLTYEITTSETYKTWQVLRTEGVDPEWDGLMLARYAEEAENYAFFSMTNLDMQEQGILIRELKMDLLDFDLTPFPTPTPSPTPDPSRSGTTLYLNSAVFERGDTFRLSRTLINAGDAIVVDEYIILDIYGSYWFWPEWSEMVSSTTRTLGEMSIYPDEVALTFVWPDVIGSVEDLRFWSALLSHTNQTLFGDYDVVIWGYR